MKPAEEEVRFVPNRGLNAFRSTIAELHVHRAFVAIDPTAEHIGGNAAVRDHQLFDNTVWVNTKLAWEMTDPAMLGFSPVNWDKARDATRPDYQLDLVALVPIGGHHITFRDTSATSLEIRWDCPSWWLVPASELQSLSRPDGRSRARSLVQRRDVEVYRISPSRTLTRTRLRKLISQNVLAT